MPPPTLGVMASVNDGHGYGPNRVPKSDSTAVALVRYVSGASAIPSCTPTLTCTGLGADAVPVTILNRPIERAKSRMAVAVQWPGRSLTPLASTLSPSGTVTVTSKSATGAVDA